MNKYAFVCLLFIVAVTCDDSEDNDEVPLKERIKEFTPHTFESPALDFTNVIFYDLFNDERTIGKSWKVSTARKDGLEETLAKYNGVWTVGPPSKVVLDGDLGLIAQSKARHHAIAAPLEKPLEFGNHDEVIIQYEVKYEEGQECGGGYVKLLNDLTENDITNFNDKTEYTIMFGPDKCGAQSKVHFIIKLQNPKNGSISEHHAPQPKSIPEFADKKTHVFKVILKRDNNYNVFVDDKSIYYGSLLKDAVPSVQPPTQIHDPNDKKPAEWDDEEYIVDPDAKKPEDWDEDQPKEIVDEDATMPSDWLETEEANVPDSEAVKPEDWDEEMDGAYEPRMISNPACEGLSGCGAWKKPIKANPNYKGKWMPSKIKNSNYKGIWSAELIDNPHYYEANPYEQLKPVTAVGFELWTISPNILFDNIFIGDDAELAAEFVTQTYTIKVDLENKLDQIENPSTSIFTSIIEATEERPWLWIVYVLCVLIPIVALSAYFYTRKASTLTDAKKTDEYQPDDNEDATNAEQLETETADDENDLSEADAEPVVVASVTRSRSGSRSRKTRASKANDENVSSS